MVPALLGLTGAVLIVAYLSAPPTQSREAFAAGAAFLAGLSMLAAALMMRVVRPTGWGLMAGGMALFGVARLAAASEWYGSLGPVFPGAYQATELLAFPALMLGLVGARPSQHRSNLLLAGVKPAIYAVVATALVWLAFTGPYFEGDGLPLSADVWVFVGPVLIAGYGALAWFRGRRAQAPTNTLAGPAAIGVMAITELVHNAAWHNGSDPTGIVGAVWMVGPITIAVVTGLPRLLAFMRRRSEPRPTSWSHLVALLVASVGALAVLVVAAVIGIDSESSRLVICAAALITVLLAVLESARLAGEIREYVDVRGAARLAAMVEHSSDVVLASDATGVVSYASPGVQMMLGRDPDDVTGRHVLDVFTGAERATLEGEFERLVTLGNAATLEFESDVVHADGSIRKATAVIANLLGSESVNGIVTTLRDVTEQRNLERQLSHRAFHDELTGLANRALFLDRMDHALRVTRSEADPVVVLFVDLADFKRVNDSFGHG